MRRWSPVFVILVACGSKPPPQEPIASTQARPQPPSCADAGTILRGPIGSDDPKAGPAREQAIAAACRDDRWSAEVLSCVTASRQPAKCVDKLTAPQRTSYQAKLETWSTAYGGDTYGGDMYGGDTAMLDRYTDCGDLVDDPGRYPPSVDANAAEHDWVVAQRRTMIERICNTEGWTEVTKECIEVAPDGTAIDVCLRTEPSQPLLAKQLGELDRLAAKIAAAKTKPASIACAKVVDAHYGDARWKDKLAGVKPADRKQQIAASRKAMQKACTDEHWTDTVRACVVVDGGDRCFDTSAWGYPALVAGGLPAECQAYKANIDRLVACDKLPQAARDAMKQAYDQASQGWASLPPDALANLATACRAGADAVQQAGASTCKW